MTQIEIDNLQPGDKIYTVLNMGTLIENTYISTNTGKFLFKNEQGNKVTMSELQLEYCYLDKDKAILEWYINEQESLTSDINQMKERILKKEKKLQKLDNKYSYLKIKFPEEFI